MGLTQAKFGARLGVSKFTVSKWETDVHDPGSAFLFLIAQDAQVTADWLLGLSDESASTTYFPPNTHSVDPTGEVWGWHDDGSSHPDLYALRVTEEVPTHGWSKGDYLLCDRRIRKPSHGALVVVEHIQSGRMELREVEEQPNSVQYLLSLDRLAPAVVLSPTHSLISATVTARQSLVGLRAQRNPEMQPFFSRPDVAARPDSAPSGPGGTADVEGGLDD